MVPSLRPIKQDVILAIVNELTPNIVCLCGSTRFLIEERVAYFAETMKGNIVLSHSGMRTPDKITGGKLDKLHLRKIDLADEILVLNVNGYIGNSTRNEIAYARSQSKPIRFLNPVPDVDLQYILSTPFQSKMQ